MDLNGQRLLLIKQSSLGDIVHALPVVHALKRCYPACHIGWVVEQGFASLVERDKAVDAVYPMHIPSTSSPDAPQGVFLQAGASMFRVLLQLRTVLRRAPYDIVLDLHASLRSALLGRMNPGGLRIGLADARELNTFFQDQLIEIPPQTVHALEKNLLVCRWAGCEVRADDFFLSTSLADRQGVETFLADAGLAPEDRLVYVNPTARWQSKFWLQSRWSALCDQLQTSGLRTVLGGSPGDKAYIEGIVLGMTTPAVVAAGRLSLAESAALMGRAAAYVGLDTGPMHMAAMAGTPVVALFGPTHPERVGPYGTGHRVLQAEGVDCLCCRKRTCAQPRCMEGLTVERVAGHVLALARHLNP